MTAFVFVQTKAGFISTQQCWLPKNVFSDRLYSYVQPSVQYLEKSLLYFLCPPYIPHSRYTLPFAPSRDVSPSTPPPTKQLHQRYVCEVVSLTIRDILYMLALYSAEAALLATQASHASYTNELFITGSGRNVIGLTRPWYEPVETVTAGIPDSNR